MTESTTASSEKELNRKKLRQILKALKTSCRIVIGIMYSQDFRNVLALAHEEDMMEGFVYIGPEADPPLGE